MCLPPCYANFSGESSGGIQPIEFTIPMSKPQSSVQLLTDTSLPSESDDGTPLASRSPKGRPEQPLITLTMLRGITKRFEPLPLKKSPTITLPQPSSAAVPPDGVPPSADFSRKPNFHDQSRSLILKIKEHAERRVLITGLAGLMIEDAQHMIDFLNIVRLCYSNSEVYCSHT